MSISTVITGGYGSFGDKSLVITQGYGQVGAVVPTTTRQTGGLSKKHKQRVIIEIDGEDFEVSSYQEAVEVLSQVKELAVETAPKVVAEEIKIAQGKTYKSKESLLKSAIPEILIQSEVPEQLAGVERLVKDTQNEISMIYRKQAKAELDRLAREEEEEIINIMMIL